MKSTDNKNTKNEQENKASNSSHKGIKLEEEEENIILEVKAKEKEVFQAKENFLVTQCIICKKSGHESKNCYFRCTKCKIPNHSQRDY